MILTNAIVEIHRPDGTIYDWVSQAEYRVRPDPVVTFELADGALREVPVEDIDTSVPGRLEAVTLPSSYPVVVRPVEEDDTFILAAGRSAPMPIEVLRNVEGGGRVPEVHALIDDDGDVFTLALFAPEQPYVRFDNAWHAVSEPSVITDYSTVRVADAAVDIFDSADIQGKQVSVFSLPLAPDEAPVELGIPAEGQPTPEPDAPVVASLASYPVIASTEDLQRAIEIASDFPEVRWYVEKRALALGADVELPWSE